jgi:hypothetical protein
VFAVLGIIGQVMSTRSYVVEDYNRYGELNQQA